LPLAASTANNFRAGIEVHHAVYDDRCDRAEALARGGLERPVQRKLASVRGVDLVGRRVQGVVQITIVQGPVLRGAAGVKHHRGSQDDCRGHESSTHAGAPQKSTWAPNWNNRPPGVHHIGFNVGTSVTTTVERLERKGVEALFGNARSGHVCLDLSRKLGLRIDVTSIQPIAASSSPAHDSI
jgi:hypothetical protein